MIRILTVLACVAAFSSAATATEQTDVLRPVIQFIDSMNKGDLKSALAACSDEMSIIDNVAPYVWHGKDACQRWASSQEADSTNKGVTDLVFEVGTARHFEVTQDNAYAVLPASYTFTQKGKPGYVQGTFTAVLQKGPLGWQMTGFAFSAR